MAKRRLPQTSASSKRTRVAAATNNVASTPEASPEPASKHTPQRQSPRKALAAASQATASQATDLLPVLPFESQFLESQAEAEIVASTEGSQAGTVAIIEAGGGGQDEASSAQAESFDGIDWARLPDFIKPLARSKRPKS
jgi:hypothetical protein